MYHGKIFNLFYRNVIDVKHLLNYLNKNDTIMKLLTNEKIIEFLLNDMNGHESNDSSIIPTVIKRDLSSSSHHTKLLITLRAKYSRNCHALQKIK